MDVIDNQQIKKGKKSYKYTTMNDYAIKRELGSGLTCKVKLGVHQKTGEQRAIKILKKKFEKDESVKRELDFLLNFEHPYVVNMIEYNQKALETKPSGNQKTRTIIVLELCKNGNLIDYIFETGQFTDETCRYFFNQLLVALQAIHAEGYCHRDLKPDNVLLDDEFNLKLADFGFASQIKNDKLSTVCGTQPYMAPEIVANQEYSGQQADLWAAAVILFVMKTGSFPFVNKASMNDQLFKMMAQTPENYWDYIQDQIDGIDDDFVDLLSHMLEAEPKNRYSIDEILDHDYMKGDVSSKQSVIMDFTMRNKTIQEVQAAELAAQRSKKKRQQNNKQSEEAFRGDEVMKVLNEIDYFKNVEKDKHEMVFQNYTFLNTKDQETWENELTKRFDTYKTQREAESIEDPYSIRFLNRQFIEENPKEAFKIFLIYLTQAESFNKKFVSKIALETEDDEQYTINISIQNKEKGNTHIKAQFLEDEEGMTVVSFSLEEGNCVNYSKAVKFIKKGVQELIGDVTATKK